MTPLTRLAVAGLFLLVLMSTPAAAQTVKYSKSGDLTWIGSLLADSTGCEGSKAFTGQVVKSVSMSGDNAVGFEFSLRLATKKQERFQASLSLDEGAIIPDFEEMTARGHRLKVKARQCGSGGYWTIEEIWRL